MPLQATIKAAIRGLHSRALDLGAGNFQLDKVASLELLDGVGVNQADRLFTDQRTITASANDDLDLAAVLTDVFGQAITFARIKAILIVAAAANVNDLVVGAAAANAFVGPFGASTHTVKVRPGGFLLLACADATGWAVTAGTADILRVANGAGGSSVVYDIVLIGASA